MGMNYVVIQPWRSPYQKLNTQMEFDRIRVINYGLASISILILLIKFSCIAYCKANEIVRWMQLR